MVSTWTSDAATQLIGPAERHQVTLTRLLREVGQGGNWITDAHLAALAIEHNAGLLSFDADFARSEKLGLRCAVPR